MWPTNPLLPPPVLPVLRVLSRPPAPPLLRALARAAAVALLVDTGAGTVDSAAAADPLGVIAVEVTEPARLCPSDATRLVLPLLMLMLMRLLLAAATSMARVSTSPS